MFYNLSDSFIRTHTREIYKFTKIKPINVCINSNIVNNIHLIKNDLIKSNTKLFTVQEIHNYKTRRSNYFFTPRCVTTKFGLKGILPHAVKVYNSLPLDIINSPKNKFKLLAANYFY